MKTKITIVAFIIFTFFSSTAVFSQTPGQQWDADFGGSDNEQFAAGIQTKYGGYLVGGYSESGISGDKNPALLSLKCLDPSANGLNTRTEFRLNLEF